MSLARPENPALGHSNVTCEHLQLTLLDVCCESTLTGNRLNSLSDNGACSRRRQFTLIGNGEILSAAETLSKPRWGSAAESFRVRLVKSREKERAFACLARRCSGEIKHLAMAGLKGGLHPKRRKFAHISTSSIEMLTWNRA